MPSSNKKWGLRSKVWLELEGQPLIGEGRLAMLQAIDRHGSILRASREIGISYRRMRGAIRDMEDALGRPLVLAYRGGEEGGGASLTAAARDLVESYLKVAAGLRRDMDSRFLEVFG
jgi:molybdate transport system regulatory protein